MQPGLTNRLLGYPENQRLLLLNADDFGMCHAINRGIIDVLEADIIRSTSLMVCTPWANEAAEYLRQHPCRPFWRASDGRLRLTFLQLGSLFAH